MIGGINTVSVYGSGTIVHYCFVRGLSEVLEASLILVASSNKKIRSVSCNCCSSKCKVANTPSLSVIGTKWESSILSIISILKPVKVND